MREHRNGVSSISGEILSKGALRTVAIKRSVFCAFFMILGKLSALFGNFEELWIRRFRLINIEERN